MEEFDCHRQTSCAENMGGFLFLSSCFEISRTQSVGGGGKAKRGEYGNDEDTSSMGL